jgi:glycosyltransferase involved in cell wall biosynthesis
MKRLRIAFVVQRYGVEVNGGAEAYCRILAERMARYFDVDVATTCAIDYHTWRNEYPEGATTLNGVCVRRFAVDKEREPQGFVAFCDRFFRNSHTREDEIRWIEEQGPCTPRLLAYLEKSRTAYDAFVFQTYLYYTTYFGLPLVADRAVLVPTAHDELPIYLGIFDALFEKARRLLCLTPEELAFLRRRFFHLDLNAEVLGMGLDPAEEPPPDSEWDALRSRMGDCPFVLYIGRIDESKGCGTLVRFFERYVSERRNESLKLLMLGRPGMPISGHPQVVAGGFVSEAAKIHAIRACRFMIAPAPNESLCIAALEAWRERKPVLANGDCRVLRGQCIRSNGGLWYDDFEGFRAAMDRLLGDESLARALGWQGGEFVKRNYAWREFDERLTRILSAVASGPASPA